jgi:type I thyroxine 5'-deiodinase
MYRDFKDRAEFFVVYIQEAHASDGWQMDSNIRDKVVYANPRSYGERGELATTCVVRLGIELPALVDDFDNSTERAYTGWPDRLYVIDKQGRVRYKANPGPFGFKPAQVRRLLESGSLW